MSFLTSAAGAGAPQGFSPSHTGISSPLQWFPLPPAVPQILLQGNCPAQAGALCTNLGQGFPTCFCETCGKSSQGMSKSQITSLYFSVDFTDFDLKNSCFGDKFPLPLLQGFLVIPSLLQKLCLVGCLYHTVHFR